MNAGPLVRRDSPPRESSLAAGKIWPTLKRTCHLDHYPSMTLAWSSSWRSSRHLRPSIASASMPRLSAEEIEADDVPATESPAPSIPCAPHSVSLGTGVPAGRPDDPVGQGERALLPRSRQSD